MRFAPEPIGKGPPMFVVAAADDMLGIDSLDLHRAWRDAGLPVELHLFERGDHGFGATPTDLPVDAWQDLFLAWHRTHT